MNNKSETLVEAQPGYTSEFLRGFADASGVSLLEAREYWREHCKNLRISTKTRERIEAGGYTAGRDEGHSLAKPKRMGFEW